jgi:hypothetical protein
MTSRHSFLVTRVAIGMMVVLSANACVSIHAPSFLSSPESRNWPRTLRAAEQSAAAGRFDAADSLLAEFARRHPGTDEARETAYWRALFQLDPSNKNASLTVAMASLDAYLADGKQREHTVEAATLKRAAAKTDGLTRLAATAVSQAQQSSTDAEKAKAQAADAKAAGAESKAAATDAASLEAENKRLKDELAKANAELERIRRRLQTPPGKP